MTTLERAIRKAIRDKLGCRIGEVRAYVIDPTWSDDYDAPADDAVDLSYLCKHKCDGSEERQFKGSCAIDCYPYYPENANSFYAGDLIENVEIRFDANMNIIAVLDTREVIFEKRS